MSKFTKENPFEFGPHALWRDADSGVAMVAANTRSHEIATMESYAQAGRSFIEAEMDSTPEELVGDIQGHVERLMANGYPGDDGGLRECLIDIVADIAMHRDRARWAGAERDEATTPEQWHYTNEDETEARKGPWLVSRPNFEDAWYLLHDDLTDGSHITAIFFDSKSVDENAAIRGTSPGCVKAMKSFHSWKSAQEQPSEPTGFGAVVQVGDTWWTRTTNRRREVWRLEGGETARDWAYITAGGPVTIHFEGVTS